VQRPECRARLFEEAGDVAAARDIGRDVPRPSRVGVEQGGHGRRRLRRDVGDRAARALGEEGFRDGQPDAAAGAGEEGVSVLQACGHGGLRESEVHDSALPGPRREREARMSIRGCRGVRSST